MSVPGLPVSLLAAGGVRLDRPPSGQAVVPPAGVGARTRSVSVKRSGVRSASQRARIRKIYVDGIPSVTL
jgi:hypothetical protein